MKTAILTAQQILDLRNALFGREIVVCNGGGVDSTAVLVALHAAGITPRVITFADTGAEKAATYAHIERFQAVLDSWRFPRTTTVKKIPLATTGYSNLEGNCVDNETLPSLAFGMKSCSIKWKQDPQDYFIKGCKSGPNACAPHAIWSETQARGERIVKLIGYDAGKADLRRSSKVKSADADFDYVYPLQILGWTRAQCVKAIIQELGVDFVPIKSACFFCPASKAWELFWLAAHEPELFERALVMERTALTGHHSRFSEVEFGDTWENMVKTGDRFPSSNTTVGLGRSFAWNQWARVNGVVDANFKVRQEIRLELARKADALRGDDNALDRRACA